MAIKNRPPNWFIGELGEPEKRQPAKTMHLRLPRLPATRLLVIASLISASVHACTVIKTDRETAVTTEIVSGILTVLAAAFAASITAIRSTTRRKLNIALAALPLAIAATPYLINTGENPREPDSYEEIPITHETYPEVVEKAKKTLAGIYLHENKYAKGKKWTNPNQLNELEDNFEKALGKEFVTDFRKSVGQKMSEREDLYKRGQIAQNQYLEKAKKSGVLIGVPENDPTFPIFCEQVGLWVGIGNNPDSLFMRKEFTPILGTLIALVNYQIGQFNENLTEYGHANFPRIPRVSAIKASGALRTFTQTYEGVQKGYPTTPDLTPHMLGTALDIGSYGTEESHMARFAGPMYDREGNLQVKPGGLLPSQGFGANTRPILLTMIGRALLAMEAPLKEETGITLMPLWEPNQLNWHVAIDPAE